MAESNLIIFGKHPAWSDHMFVSDDAPISHYLKRIVYDHSIIPSLQEGKGDQRISGTSSFLVFINDQIFFIVNSVSRDSVGRRRFPFIVAYPVPAGLRIDTILSALRSLKQQLLDFSKDMLEASHDDLTHWQLEVKQKAKAFNPDIEWPSICSGSMPFRLNDSLVASLMSRLLEGHDALNLDLCSFAESCDLVQIGLKQFKSKPPAMLILNEKERGEALFYASEDGSSFRLKNYLAGSLPSLKVSEDKIPERVNNLLKSSSAENEGLLSVDEAPSMKLGSGQNSGTNKFLIAALLFALAASVILCFIYSGEIIHLLDPDSHKEDPPAQQTSETKTLSQMPEAELTPESLVRDEWIANATAYVEWVQPLTTFVANSPSSLPSFDAVSEAVKSELNPFAVIGIKARMQQARNPPNGIFEPANAKKLDRLYSNIDRLKAFLTDYYGEQFTDQLAKQLDQQGYSLPLFIKTDFLQQPILPAFGSALVQQLSTCLQDRKTLSKLVEITSLFESSVINPLYQVYPEHADYLKSYFQKLIVESESMKRFKQDNTTFLQAIRYPKWIQINEVNLEALSGNADWLALPEEEQSLELVLRLIYLLNEHLEGTDLDDKQQLGDSQGSESQDALVEINLDDWNVFLEFQLEEHQDAWYASEMRKRAIAMQADILEDTTLNSIQAFELFQEKIAQLSKSFQLLNIDFIHEISDLHAAYLKGEESTRHLTDFIIAEYEKASPAEEVDLKSVASACEAVSLDINTLLAELDKALSELKTAYLPVILDDVDASDLARQIGELTQNPLYFEGVFDSRVSTIQAIVSKDKKYIEKASDLIWYLELLTSEGKVTDSQLTKVTESYNRMEQESSSSKLNYWVRLAFDNHVKQLTQTNPTGLLSLYKDLGSHLPETLYTTRDQELKQIADYWYFYSSNLNAETPTKEQLKASSGSAALSGVQAFYQKLLDEYDNMSFQEADTSFDEISSVEGVSSVYVHEDLSQIDITFEGLRRKLVFLPLKTSTGTVFVQQKPLTLKQYIVLSNICGRDTEYYLAAQDSLWPRSFEVGMGQSFMVLNQWQFRNKEIFTPIASFTRSTLPAHLNEPREILYLAQYFGFRLFKPYEGAVFIKSANTSSARNRLQFSATDLEGIARVNTIISSVYAAALAIRQQETLTGGIDFERGIPGERQFFDVIGGSAEVAYDGSDFYAFGGSWLYVPEKPEKLLQLSNPRRMYIDLGVRFVIDAPKSSYVGFVQRIALQLMTENN